jgi:type II secretory pathway pseudopilin PulG
MKRKSFALTELIIAIVMISSIIAMSLSIYVFFSKQIMIYRERYNMLSQINYAFEDMAVRTKSAVQLDAVSTFSLTGSAISDTKTVLKFSGEENIYVVTPDEKDDNTWYEYRIDNGSVVVETLDKSGNYRSPRQITTLVDASISRLWNLHGMKDMSRISPLLPLRQKEQYRRTCRFPGRKVYVLVY